MSTVQLHDLRFEPFISEQELGKASDHIAGGDHALVRHPLGSIAAGAYMVVVDGARVGKIIHGH